MTFIQNSLHNGLISRWDRGDFPLPIYIEKCRWYAAKGEEYKYNNMVLRALKDWEAKTNGLIRFNVVEKLYDSNTLYRSIGIVLENFIDETCNSWRKF